MNNRRILGRRTPAALAIAVIVAATTPLAATGSGSAPAAQAPNAEKSQLYIVQVAGDPVASYDGGVAGLTRTSPIGHRKLDVDSQAVKAYDRYLTTKHNQTLRRAGLDVGQKKVDFSIAFNGYAAKLTEAEATRLSHTKGVAHVWENEVVEADTSTTPAFLGLSGPGGTWARQFGGAARAGEGVIVGVLDTGFWPGPSFAPLPEPRPDAADIAAQWHGTCDVGVEEPVSCNNKVLGARWYNFSGLAQDHEFLSPRDFNGHGSHTASTAAGNNNVAATINGVSAGNVSGMAPAARLAVYKVLWHNADTGLASGGTADLVAAIDDAVADGVDVINYSISGSRTLVVDPVEIAFLNAAASNVFVATSAGNNGDTIGTSSVAHNAPWTTTVAASTHDRSAVKTLSLGNGASHSGVGVGPAVPSSPLIDSEDAGLPTADPLEARLCFVGVLDPAKVTGKIVLCTRGVNARTDKSLAVQQAGGVGMILFNPTPNSLNADYHFVPSIHIDNVAGPAVKAYASTAGATASISAASTTSIRAPEMGTFSSFGPALAAGGDLLKPDITAPGVDVIAAVAPPNNAGNTFSSYQGTSMSTPHIAGIAALIRSARPTWAPMWIKSALMTNATPLDNRGLPIQRSGRAATPLDFGSGHVRPGLAFDPGLVYDSEVVDWIQFGCGIGQIQLITDPSFCASLGSIDPSDLNYPSIAVGNLAGRQTVTRTFTNTSPDQASQYKAAVQAPTGFTVRLSKSKITVPPLQSRSYSVTVTRTTAPLGQWGFGSITWTDKRGHAVRSPLAIRPVELAAPPEVALTGTSGTSSLTVQPGYTGTLTASVAGLVPATVTPMTLNASGPDFDPNAPAASPRTGVVTATVSPGTSVARFATFDADYPQGTDLDVFVYRVAGSARILVGSGAGSSSQETVTLNNPAAGTYEAYIHLFATGSGTTVDAKPNHWLLGTTPAGNLTATPASQSVTTGTPATINVGWSGLTPNVRHLGALHYGNGTANIGRTLVTVS